LNTRTAARTATSTTAAAVVDVAVLAAVLVFKWAPTALPA
jgi:hypothetical protein